MAQSNDAMEQLAAAVQRLTEVMEMVAAPEEAAARARAAAQATGQEFANRNEIMVSLINSHNPYTSNDVADMSIFAGNPDPANIPHNVNQIELEVDGPYTMAMEWNFKGSPQKINKTLRLKYRYRARNLTDPARPLLQPHHWVTAYLLIGFEDGGA